MNAMCPECEIEMVLQIDPDSGGFLECPKCGIQIDAEDEEET